MEKILGHLPHPYAWLDLHALDENIAFIRQACGEKSIRIATKSIRNVDVLKYIQSNLQNVSGFMTFTAAETLYLLEQGLDHLLIGYPVYEPDAIRKLVRATIEGKDVTFMVDHIAQLQLLDEIGKELQAKVQICIDLNVSTKFPGLYFGTKRSPIFSFDTLERFLQQICTLGQLKMHGVMAYDAQIAGVADGTNNAKSILIRKLKAVSLPKITNWRQFAIGHIKSYADVTFVNGGGSGSMAYCANESDLTEITVGSAFFAPALFDQYDSLQLKPAAGFALRVTRRFRNNIVVAHGGGFIASGVPGQDRLPKFLQPERFAFTSLEGAGEVQTPIIVKQGNIDIGDTILLRHAKAGELCERFMQLHAVRGDQYIGPMTTYRGDGQCFL